MYEDTYDNYGSYEYDPQEEERRRRRQQQVQTAEAQQGQPAQKAQVTNQPPPPGSGQTANLDRYASQVIGWDVDRSQQPSDYRSLGKYANKLRGYDMEKFNRPFEDWSEKYKIGAVQSHFDPLQGVSPEYIAALNSLGIAQFGGGGDKLSVTNTRNDPRFGRGGTADVVYGLKGQNQDTAWQPWFVDEGGGAPSFMPQQTIATSLGGSPTPMVVPPPPAVPRARLNEIGDLPTYTPSKFSQFDYAGNPGIEAKYRSTIDQVLSNPVISDAQAAMLKERQKEAALQMANDQLGQATQSAIRRGVYGTSGAAEAVQRGIREKSISDILSNYRDIDLTQADLNRQGQERGAGLAESFLSGGTNRALGRFDALLRGQTAQADENKAGFGSEVEKIKFQLQKALAEHGMSIDEGQLANEARRLAESARQYNMGHSLDERRFGEGVRQFNSQMGLNWADLGQRGQQALIDRYLRF